MSLSICSFASGSSGNCIFVSSDSTKILIDVGISPRRVEHCLAALNQRVEDVSILVTHSHSDHIKYIPALLKKYDIPVYSHRKTMPALRGGISSFSRKSQQNGADFASLLSFSKGCSGKTDTDDDLTVSNQSYKDSHKIDLKLFNEAGKKEAKLIPFGDGDFFIGDITVSPFVVSHDVHCVGYSFYHRGKKLTVTTDLGRLDSQLVEHIEDSDAVFIESNHDLELISANPNYSEWLKRRILSEKGHLSNKDCAKAVLNFAKTRAKNIILGHLSEENNYPELAFSEVCELLSKNGIKEGRDILVEVATAAEMSSLITVE